MDDHRIQVFELIERAERDDYAPHTGALLEEAFRIAEGHRDFESALLARYLYVFAVAPLEPRKALVAFAWCIGHEEHAGPFVPATSLAQLHGIAIGILRSFPEYTLEQIERTFLEMERRYRELGLPRRDYLHHRIYGALAVGDRDQAAEYFDAWSRMEPDPGACSVCDRGTRVLYHLNREEYAAALAWGAPILSGDEACNDGQPLMTQAAMIIPLARMGRLEEAARHYRASVQNLGPIGYAGIWVVARQLAYLAMAGDAEEAAARFERFFPTAIFSGTPSDRFGFYIAASLLMRRLEAEGMLAPAPAAGFPGPDTRQPSVLRDWFDAEVADLAAAFDRRNQNGEYTRICSVFLSIYEQVRAMS